MRFFPKFLEASKQIFTIQLKKEATKKKKKQ